MGAKYFKFNKVFNAFTKFKLFFSLSTILIVKQNYIMKFASKIFQIVYMVRI